MSIINQGVLDFIQQTQSKTANPGGGSISALIGVFGSSLVQMYQNITMDKKKFLTLDLEIQEMYKDVYAKLSKLNEDLLHYVDEDSKVYLEVVESYKTKDETLIQKSILKATEVPYLTMKTAYTAMELIEQLLPYGNIYAVSDAAIGAILLKSAVECAAYNIRINLSGLLEDQQIEYKTKMNELLENSHKLCERITTLVNQQIER